MILLSYMDKHILIIEDEPDIREAMAEAVMQAGLKVSTAANGSLGLTKALGDHPDLILLDIVMPVMDGHQCLRKLRQDSWGKTAKVIMLTSMDDMKNIGGAHENTITDYIIKAHSSLDEIIKKVQLALYTD